MGALDSPIRNLVPTVLKIFRSSKTTLTRSVATYDEDTDTETIASQIITLVTSPPLPYTLAEVDEKNILRTDLQLFVSSKELEAESFDPQPGDNIQVKATIKGKTYQVRYAESYDSGDESAMWRLQLR